MAFDQNTVERLREALDDRYAIEREVGVGGMAMVFLAKDLKHNRNVAVKVLDPGLAEALGAERFLREIEVAANFQHPHILPLFDSGEADGLLYYVMPYVEGESLRDRLEREGQLPLGEALEIAREVADGLGYAHSLDIVHRDIKPENILLSGGHAVVADFGIARALSSAGGRLTKTGGSVGSPLYMSPEQAGGRVNVDGRSDLYSLACMLYEMLAGEPPFSGQNTQALIAKHAMEPPPDVRVLRSTVPDSVGEAIRKALAKSPADRPRTVGEFAAILSKVAAEKLSRATTPPPGRGSGETIGTDPLLAAGRSATGRRLYRPIIIGVTVLLAALAGLNHPRIRAGFTQLAGPRYASVPEWTGWSTSDTESFPVVAVMDSFLTVASSGSEAVYTFDGNRWTRAPVPDSFTLMPYRGVLAGSRLLVRKTQATASGREYAWLAQSGAGWTLADHLPEFPPGEVGAYWWSDGPNLTVWLHSMRRLEEGRWVHEATGTSSMIRDLWGLDVDRRRALVQIPQDSLLEYDGITWQTLDINPDPSSGSPRFQGGNALRDGTSVVFGEICDDEGACRLLLLQEGAPGRRWRDTTVPPGAGVPVVQQRDTVDGCPADGFSFVGAAGGGQEDYYVWGRWETCDPGPPRRQAEGCPPDQPCTWHVENNRIQPIEDLVGKVVHTMVSLGGEEHALLDDGTLWRRIGESWRPVTQVPDLPMRLVAASGNVLVKTRGSALTYEPGRGNTSSRYVVSPALGLPRTVTAEAPPRSIVVRDSSVALLSGLGEVFSSTCPVEARLLPSRQMALSCKPWTPLPSPPGPVTAIGFLKDGSLFGVGVDGLAVTWSGEEVVPEVLPHEAQTDSLWGISCEEDGTVTVIGKRTVLERSTDGTWSLVRLLPPSLTGGSRFATLLNGDLVISGAGIHLWDRSPDSLPVLALRQNVVGAPQASDLLVLPDGRLVAGFSVPYEPSLGGWLQVWAPPIQPDEFLRIDLPRTIDITDLAHDGEYLYVVGQGGGVTIAIDSLAARQPGDRPRFRP